MRGKPPVVSVIMPVFNCCNFITEAVTSILDQTFRDFELIIIDDCSTDKTAEIIKSFGDERINFIQKPEKSGLVASLNMGIGLAQGKFIARMDGDDVCDKIRFEKQVKFLEDNPDVILCGSAIKLIGNESIAYYPVDHEDIKICLLDFCPIVHPTVMIRKEFIDKYNLKYIFEFEGAEDYELWTRCAFLGKMANMRDVLLTYRVHQNQFSTINKTNQDTNSALCRVNMLKVVWEKASLADEFTRELLFQNETYKDIKKLNEIINWMDELISLNKLKAYFELAIFEEFIFRRKQNSIRRFFLNQVTYKPAISYQLIKDSKKYSAHFNTLEYVRLAIKCMVSWKPNPIKK